MLPVPLMVPPITLAPGSLSTGMDSPVTIELIDGASAFLDGAVYRHAVARADPQTVADLKLLQRNFFVIAVAADSPCRFRREVQQRPDGAAGLLARPQFQNLAEQAQHGDHGGSLEIDRDHAVLPQRLREQPRGEQSDQAVAIGGADAQSDQAEHVERAISHRGEAAHKERPTRPQHHGRRQEKLCPRRYLWRNVTMQLEHRHVRAHLQNNDRRGEHETPIQKRRVMSINSALGPVFSPTLSGSSAIPQIGHAPGPTCRICGCIGQV